MHGLHPSETAAEQSLGARSCIVARTKGTARPYPHHLERERGREGRILPHRITAAVEAQRRLWGRDMPCSNISEPHSYSHKPLTSVEGKPPPLACYHHSGWTHTNINMNTRAHTNTGSLSMKVSLSLRPKWNSIKMYLIIYSTMNCFWWS